MNAKKLAVLALAAVAVVLLWKDKQEDEKKRARAERESKEDGMNRSAQWIRLMMVAFVMNGLGPFGLKVMAEKGLLQQYPLPVPAVVVRGIGDPEPRGVHDGTQLVRLARGGDCLGHRRGELWRTNVQSHGAGAKRSRVHRFPITTGGNLFVVAAGGVLIYKERIGRYGIAGIAVGVLSLVLLSLG